MRCKLKYMLLCASMAAVALVETTAHAQPPRGPYTLMASEVSGGAVKATGGPYTLLASVTPPPVGAGELVGGPYEVGAGSAVTLVSEDCNTNGIPDDDDIAAGTSADCNTNGIPDECEPEEDCNTNGFTDICDIGAGTSADCNHNLVPDECELATHDCNNNGVPDDCDIVGGTSEDCNTNAIPDECDMAQGTSQDCQSNGIPDECELAGNDCNTNGVPDGCDIVGGTSPDCNTNALPDECDIAQGTSHDCQPNGIPDECETDCNDNGVADECDIAAGTSQDCNTNAVPDECETDCNANGIPDDCDIAEGTSEDCQTNGIPDECETDCNANGIPDDCDLAQGTSRDCDANGTPDECDTGGADGRPQDCNDNDVPDLCDIVHGTSADADSNGIPDECPIVSCRLGVSAGPPGARIPLDVFVENVADLRGYVVTIRIQKLQSGDTGAATVEVPCPAGVVVDDTRVDFVFFGLPHSLATDCPYRRLGSMLDAGGVAVGVPPAYLGTYLLDISADADEGSVFRVSVLVGAMASTLWNSSLERIGFAVGPGCDLITEDCQTPIVEAVGSRYLRVTPTRGQAPIALRVTSPDDEDCLEQYVDFDPDPALAALRVGRLGPVPVFRTPSAWGTVYVGDAGIIPGTTYEVDAACPGETTASATTWLWADVNHSGGPVNEDDLQCLLDGFGDDFSICSLWADDLMGQVPNADVDMVDFMACQNAIGGAPYPYPDPCAKGAQQTEQGAGPMFGPVPMVPLSQAVLTVVPQRDTLAPGETVTVEVSISNAADLRGYQVALEVSGGTQGGLVLESLSIDPTRGAYVFAGLEDVRAVDLAGQRLAAALPAGGIACATPKYAGTYVFRATPDAQGSFQLRFRPSSETFLRDSGLQAIAIRSAAPATVHVAAVP